MAKLSVSQLAELRYHLESLVEIEHREEVQSSFSAFVREFSDEPAPARHHTLLIDKLQQVADGDIKRLMICMPPGSAKSTYTSKLFSPWWIQRNPGKLIVGTSHDAKLAERFSRKVRNIVQEAEYVDLFNVALRDDSRAVGQWETTTEAEYYAVGTGGSITGRRADLGLLDDPVKGRKDADSETAMSSLWEWYLSDFRTRLKPDAAIILVNTRWSENDLSGRILPEDYDGRSGSVIARDGEVWEVINLPMEARESDVLGREVGELLWPQWFTPEWVAQEKRTLGPRNWNCLHQQDPTPDEGALFKREDMQWYKRKPSHLKTYITGDYAVTENDGDFTEIGVWGVCPKDNIYLLDQFRGQVDSLDVVEQLIDFIEKYEPIVSISESGVIRRSIEPLIKKRMRERKAFSRLEWLPTTGDKVAMSRSFQAMTQLGVIHLPVNDKAELLMSQLVKFPAGVFDDGVDMCGLLGRYMDKLWKGVTPEKAKKPLRLKGNNPSNLTIADVMEHAYE